MADFDKQMKCESYLSYVSDLIFKGLQENNPDIRKMFWQKILFIVF